ncbi:MAG: hypothetical protein H7A37_07265 [Chlamydiales bacterium]|nr:hypothetical protein [Chlamydiia bacterium]MCP5508082.1 hypothetical protein [Chlamydiales bacterium]
MIENTRFTGEHSYLENEVDQVKTESSWNTRAVKWFRVPEGSDDDRKNRKILAIFLAVILSSTIIGIIPVVLAAKEWKKQDQQKRVENFDQETPKLPIVENVASSVPQPKTVVTLFSLMNKLAKEGKGLPPLPAKPPRNLSLESTDVPETVDSKDYVEIREVISTKDRFWNADHYSFMGDENKQPDDSQIFLYLRYGKDGKKIKEPLLQMLGSGGSKTAIEVSDGKALLMTKNMEENYRHWPETVQTQCRMADNLKKIGLLGVAAEKVYVSSNEQSESYFPAYVTDSFDELAKRGIYVVDRKNSYSTKWQEKLFTNQADIWDAKNWGPVIDTLMEDISKLIYYGLPFWGDSFNLAVVEDQNGYKIRYFGFDYSAVVDIDNTLELEAYRGHEERLVNCFKNTILMSLEKVLFNELDIEFGGLPSDAYGLIEDIMTEYSEDFLQIFFALENSHSPALQV